ncbi:MAG TPA: hypothetical protein VN913_08710 [Candidatus Binatus sp.]|nr:hypothetical protein [Candidatus Binatus sp.]
MWGLARKDRAISRLAILFAAISGPLFPAIAYAASDAQGPVTIHAVATAATHFTQPYKMTPRALAEKELANSGKSPTHTSSAVVSVAGSPTKASVSQRPAGTGGQTRPLSTPFTVRTNFAGLNDDGSFPPDPSIAAGPLSLVETAGQTIGAYDKTGVSQWSTSQSSFFSSLGQPATDGAFDLSVTYDPYISRFWVLAASENDSAQRATYLIALSNGSQPASATDWHFFSSDATVNQTVKTSNWCDFPRLGFDAQAIYVTCNMWSFPLDGGVFQYAKVRVMTKSELIGRVSPLLFWDDWGLGEGPLQAVMSSIVQPARSYGAAASDGEYMVDAHGQGGGDNSIEVWHFYNAQNCCVAGQPPSVNFDHTSLTMSSFATAPNAQQQGSTTLIQTGDTRILSPVWKAGRLSMTQTVGCASGAQACAAFKEIDVSHFPTMSTINDWVTTSETNRYYPAVDSNALGDRTIVYSASSSTQYASGFVASIPPSSTCTNCSNSETLIGAGLGSYVRLTPKGVNRWGDFMTAAADPDGTGIWAVAENAGTSNSWQTSVALTYEGVAQRAWVQESPANAPSARWGAPMAFDAARGTAVTFGGADSNATYLNETWTWNGTSWSKLTPTASPVARYAASMAYDAATKKTILFGGWYQVSPCCSAAVGDTWSWNGTTWKQMKPKHSPSARQWASMAYDPGRKVIVLFGGDDGSNKLADTWIWNGSDWRQMKVTGPQARSRAVIAYDVVRKRTVLFGGTNGSTDLNDTWTWNGSTWTQMTPSVAPSGRRNAQFAFDTSTGTAILFGGFSGSTILNDTWAWDGTTWSQQTYLTLNPPAARGGGLYAYYSPSRVILLFGGIGNAVLGDTWTY